MRIESPTIRVCRKELRFLIQMVVKSAVEASQEEEREIMSRILIKEIPCDVIATGYCSATEGNMNFSSFVDKVITKTIHRRAMIAMLNNSLNRRSRSDNFMQLLCEEVVKYLEFITPVAAFVTRRVIITVKEERKQ